MTQIDWSNAPEGATHYGEGHHCKFWAKDVRPGISYQFSNVYHDGPTGWMIRLGDPDYPITSIIPDWTGEGLPPVGTVCEYDARSVGKGDPLWVTVKINYLSEWTIVFECIAVPTGTKQENVGVELSACADVGTMKRFRLPRTPAQLAAEEREKAIEAMNTLVGDIDEIPTWTDALAKLYDAGYRKVEVKP